MWLGPGLSVCLGKVSAFGRLKMQCLYVAWTTTECPLRRGARIWEVKNTVFAAGTMTECPLERGVRLWEVSVSKGNFERAR